MKGPRREFLCIFSGKGISEIGYGLILVGIGIQPSAERYNLLAQ